MAKLAILALLMSGSLTAEEYRLGEVFAGYSLMHGDLQKSASGWELAAGKNLNQWLSLHVDFDGHHQSASGSQRHQHDFLFGPQFSHRITNFALFAHAFSGGCHTSGNLGSETGFASVAGGGIDWDNQSFFSIRLAQMDYHTAHLFGGFHQQVRFSVGLVFHFVEFRDSARPPPRQDKTQTQGRGGDQNPAIGLSPL